MAAPPFGLQDGARLWAVTVQASEDFNHTLASELYQAQLASVLEVLFRCSELSSATDSTPDDGRHHALQRDLTKLLEDLLQWAKAPSADDSSGGGTGSGSNGGDGGGANAVSSAMGGICISPQRDDPALLALAAFNRRVVALQRTCCALDQPPNASNSSSSRSSKSSSVKSALVSGFGSNASSQSFVDRQAPATPLLVAKRVRRVSWGDAVVDRGPAPSMPQSPPTPPLPVRPSSPTNQPHCRPAAANATATGGDHPRQLPPRPFRGHPSASRRPSVEFGGAPLPFLPRRTGATVSVHS